MEGLVQLASLIIEQPKIMPFIVLFLVANLDVEQLPKHPPVVVFPFGDR